jgi:hypothetical protein
MASLPTEVAPKVKRHRISEKAGLAVEAGFAKVTDDQVLNKVEQILQERPDLIARVASMIATGVMEKQPEQPDPSSEMALIPQPCVIYGKIPAFRVESMLKAMEPDLFNTMMQQINPETRRYIFYFALNTTEKSRFDKPEPAYWASFHENMVGLYVSLGKRLSSALRNQDGQLQVQPNFMQDNGVVNWAATIGHFCIKTGHPETVVLLSLPAHIRLTHTLTLPGADKKLVVTRRKWVQDADGNFTMVMGPEVHSEDIAESGSWTIENNWDYAEAKASSGAMNLRLQPLYEAGIIGMEGDRTSAVEVAVIEDAAPPEGNNEEDKRDAEEVHPGQEDDNDNEEGNNSET